MARPFMRHWLVGAVVFFAVPSLLTEVAEAKAPQRLKDQINFLISVKTPSEIKPIIMPYASCKLALYSRRSDGQRLANADPATRAPDCSGQRASAQTLTDEKLLKIVVTDAAAREEIISNTLLAIDLQTDLKFTHTTRKK